MTNASVHSYGTGDSQSHLAAKTKTKTRTAGTGMFRVLQNSKITYRPYCPGTGGGAFFYV